MHRFRAGILAGLNDLLGDQIGFRCRRRADMDSLVRHCDMRAPCISVGIDGNRLDPHFLGGADNPAGDFATVGDQDFFEHILFGSL